MAIRSELGVLKEISKKLDLLTLVFSLNGKGKKEQIRILKFYSKLYSKRELERMTGMDRHEF